MIFKETKGGVRLIFSKLCPVDGDFLCIIVIALDDLDLMRFRFRF